MHKTFHSQFLKKGNADNSRIHPTKDAYPSIFPDLPKYLSSIPPSHSHDPQRRRDRINKHNETLMKNWQKEDAISNIDDFKKFSDQRKIES